MSRNEAIERLEAHIERLQNAIKWGNKSFDREQARKDIAAFRVAIQAIKEQLEIDDSWI